MRLFLLAVAGGAIGSGARYLVNVWAAQSLPPVFPWATFTVNVVGSFLMGAVFALVGSLLGGSPAWRVFLATGILGGFTTFSAFSLDIAELVERGQPAVVALYVGLSLALSVTALYAGMGVVRMVVR